MTPADAVQRLAEWLGPQFLAKGDDLQPIGVSAKEAYLNLVSAQAAAMLLREKGGADVLANNAVIAVAQAHAIVQAITGDKP